MNPFRRKKQRSRLGSRKTLCVIVVAVDAFLFDDGFASPFAVLADDAVHHFFAVEQGEVLCPLEFADAGMPQHPEDTSAARPAGLRRGAT